MLDLLFYIFYCAAKDDRNDTRHTMATYGIEINLTMIISFFIFLLLGFFKIRIGNYLLWIILIVLNGIFTYLFVNTYYNRRNRYKEILEKYKNTSNRKKKLYKLFVVVLFIFSFLCLFTGGIIMNYLLNRIG